MSNPWKKQADTNKAGNTGANVPPWKNKANTPQTAKNPPPQTSPPPPPTGNNATKPIPPWLNKKQQNNTQQVPTKPQGQPPIPPKNPSQQPPPTNPLNTSGSSGGGGSALPWMKNNPPGGTPPPGKSGGPPGKSGGPPGSGGSVLPWMKNKGGSQQNSNNSSRIEQQIPEIPKPEQEIPSGDPQVKVETPQGSGDQKSESQGEQQTPKNNKKKQPQSLKKSNKKQSSTKKSPIKKIKDKKNNKNTIFHRYINSISECFPNQQAQEAIQYEQKLDNQELLLKTFVQFTDTCNRSIRSYLKQRKLLQRKNNFILLNDSKQQNEQSKKDDKQDKGNEQIIYCKYYLVQSNNISETEGSSKTSDKIFRTYQMEKAQMVFSIYNILFKCIAKILKKRKNGINRYRLRVPLLSLVQFKGVYFINEAICDELTDVIQIPAENLPEIATQLTMLEKQLKQVLGGFTGINRRLFQIKKITISQGQDIYVIYLNENNPELSVQAIFENIPSIFLTPQLNITSYMYKDTSNNSSNALYPHFLSDLGYLASNVKRIGYLDYRKIKEVNKKVSETNINNHNIFTQFVENLDIAHAIRVVYASCQGELDEPSFWKLVFEGNSQLWNMITSYKDSHPLSLNDKNEEVHQIKSKFLLASLLEIFLPLKFDYQKLKKPKQNNKNKQNNIILKTENRTKIYSLENLQIIEICQLFQKHTGPSIPNLIDKSIGSIANASIKIAQKSLQTQMKLRKIIVNDKNENDWVYCGFSEQIINRNEVALLLRKQEYQKALVIVQQLVEKSHTHGSYIHKIGICLLAMTSYMLADGHGQPDILNVEQLDKDQIQKKQDQQQQKQQNKELGKEKNKLNVGDMELHILRCLSDILETLKALTATGEQIWFHANIYNLLTTYYSNKAAQIKLEDDTDISQEQILSEGSRKDEQSIIQDQNQRSKKKLYSQTSLKFLNRASELVMQYHGNMSHELADILYEKAIIKYQQKQFKDAKGLLESATKIYKPSSKHYHSLLKSLFLMGRIQLEMCIDHGNQDSIVATGEMLENVATEYTDIGMTYEAITVYQYLYRNIPAPDIFPKLGNINNPKMLSKNMGMISQYSPQYYLQKEYILALNSRLFSVLMQLNLRIINVELKVYTRQKLRILEKIYKQQKQEREAEEQQENTNYFDEVIMRLEENVQNYGNCIEMVRWAINTTLSGNFGSGGSTNTENQMAVDVLKLVLAMFNPAQFKDLIQS